jgi:hypothetical protein
MPETCRFLEPPCRLRHYFTAPKIVSVSRMTENRGNSDCFIPIQSAGIGFICTPAGIAVILPENWSALDIWIESPRSLLMPSDFGLRHSLKRLSNLIDIEIAGEDYENLTL